MNEILKTHGGYLRQMSDQQSCTRCGKVWDMNDPEPPACTKAATNVRVTVDGRTYEGKFKDTVQAVGHALRTTPDARSITARSIK